MKPIVIKLNNEQLQQIEKHYEKYLVETPPQHALFAAKKNGCTITAYKSGKVMFQGINSELEAEPWSAFIEKQPNNKQVSSAERKLPSFIESDHIGSDEAGTGDYFGPITVAAVYATPKQQQLLSELGVKDSKQMTDLTIKKVVKDILLTDIIYSTVTLHNVKYNELQRRGWTQGRMKAWLHHHAIKHVLNKMAEKPSGILIDQFCEPEIFKTHILKTKEIPIENLTFLTKAESVSIPVATASMLARYRFLQEMDKLSQLVGFDLQKGASNIVDKQISQIIKNNGENMLEQVAKVHFANTKKGRALI